MRTQDNAAFEAQDEVLAVCGNRLEDASIDALGNALGLCARMRRVGRDALADERLQATRRQVERIAFWHVSQRSRRGQMLFGAFP
jgi:hypothetical protein